jgi:hypothetical protein
MKLPPHLQTNVDELFESINNIPWTTAQTLLDAIGRSPDPPKLNLKLDKVPINIGPWRLTRDAENVTAWTVVSAPSPKDKLYFRLKNLSTKRVESNAKRLLLIGESAAGSWGYFGDFCLSSALSATLTKITSCPVEVIDLTWVNASWRRECLSLLHAGMTLNPDVVIVFCGNNEARWLLPLLHSKDQPHVPSGFSARWAFLSNDPENIFETLHNAYRENLENCVAETVRIIRSFDKPVIFVIPPFNYGDWTPPEIAPSALTGTDCIKWFQDVTAAERYLRCGELTKAEVLFRQMIDLDSSQCQRTLHGLAEAIRMSRPDEAIRLYEQALGAGLGPFVQAIPSLPSFGVSILQNLCELFEIPIVNLPEIFCKKSENGIAGREFFLDYCHLSSKGHHILVEELSRMVLTKKWLKLTTDGKDSCLENLPFTPPSPHEEALASLCAAIHSYQNGQSHQLVKYWLGASLHASAQILPILELLRKTVCSGWREYITFEWLREQGLDSNILPERFAIFILKFIYHSRFDIDFFEILSDITGMDSKARQTSFIKQTGNMLPDMEYNLKRLFFLDHRAGFGQFVREMSRRGWEQSGEDFVAYQPHSEITFPWNGIAARTLIIRVSPPCQGAELNCRILFNNYCLGTAKIVAVHTEIRLDIPSGLLCEGINSLQFDWDSMCSLQDMPDMNAKGVFVTLYGPYPVAVVLHDLRLLP